MYQTNVKDLSFSHAELYALISLLGVFVLTAFFAFLRSRFRRARLIAFVVFTASVYLLVRDFALPFPEFELSGDLPKINEYGIKAAIDVSLLLFLIICLWFLFRIQRVNYIMAIGCLGFLAADAFTLSRFENEKPRTVNVRQHLGKIAPTPQAMPNIYHIVFDGFGGRVFPNVVRKMGAEKSFEGFTYYKNIWANYYPTSPSMASVMQSNFFGIDTPKEISYPKWTSEFRNTGQGLLRKFYDHGYALSQYLDIPQNAYNVTSAQKIIGKDLDKQDRVLLLSAISAARMAPVFLRKETFKFIITLGSYATFRSSLENYKWKQPLSFYQWDSVELFSLMLNHEKQRPAYGQYIFVHIFLPHGPFHVDENCRPRNAKWPAIIKCSIKLMTDLIDTLKSLGRLKNLIILFQSDHGNNYFPLRTEDKKIVQKNSDLQKLFTYNTDAGKPYQMTRAEWAMNRMLMMARPLLLVKPPRPASSPLLVDNKLSELVDIGPTLYDLVGMNVKTSRGLPLLSQKHQGKREIHVFPESNSWRPNYRHGAPSKIKRFDQRVLPHLIYNKNSGWRHAGDVSILNSHTKQLDK